MTTNIFQKCYFKLITCRSTFLNVRRIPPSSPLLRYLSSHRDDPGLTMEIREVMTQSSRDKHSIAYISFISTSIFSLAGIDIISSSEVSPVQCSSQWVHKYLRDSSGWAVAGWQSIGIKQTNIYPVTRSLVLVSTSPPIIQVKLKI